MPAVSHEVTKSGHTKSGQTEADKHGSGVRISAVEVKILFGTVSRWKQNWPRLEIRFSAIGCDNFEAKAKCKQQVDDCHALMSSQTAVVWYIMQTCQGLA